MVQGLDAVLSVSPDTVNAISTLRMQITFDESIGKGGMLSVMILEPNHEDQELNALNRPLSFNQQGRFRCTANGASVTIRSCSAPNSRQLDLRFASNSFIMAGDTFDFTIEHACTNPSSLWFKDESLQISTQDPQGMEIETRSSFLQLSSLKPAQMADVALVFGD